MEKITAIKGIKDILPQDSPAWNQIETAARRIFGDFGFREIRVPIMEKTELFKRSIGETTDIVEKEMYTFTDRDDELITLRPEATACVIRAYIEHNMHNYEQVTKLYTLGPMFRRERPQKGRFRQFHQINAEALGDEQPQCDAEIIFMLVNFLRFVGLNDFSLEINSLGCKYCRPTFSRDIVAHLSSVEKNLCTNCQRRIRTNPLRVFDCKVDSCGEVIANAPNILSYLCSHCDEHFKLVRTFLEDLKVSYTVNSKMVRGLDYYTKTAFEVTSSNLGAQNALAGGGRYDGLVSSLGGPNVTGIGFAVGMERLMASLPRKQEHDYQTDIFIAALCEKAQKIAFLLTNELRSSGIKAQTDYTAKSLKSQMKRADKLNSSYTLIIGDNELEDKKVQLRDMKAKNQISLPLDNLTEAIKNIFKEKS
ncbi:MAG TPA: histidine--tRNA ligase [Deltaproteobacteria bacterium]|nr:histidine--tRNA ligase [Deltaproteobacteria bacterium]